MTTYRRDIDGLRTIAVLPVVLYHADLFFTGGFLGVDVFFVISGFLITSLIVNQTEGGKFSFLTFYTRRIRRLVPALIPVVLFSIWLAYVYFLPTDFKEFADSLIGVFTYTSNFVFMAQADYFAEAAGTKPLLHTWSLAVEEQFYLFMPLALFLITGFGRKVVFGALAVFAALSFGGAVWAMANDMHEQAFFNSALRFWELLAGSLLAVLIYKEPGPKTAIVMRSIGMVGLMAPMLLYTHDTLFPGWTALPPVLGTVLIIAAGRNGNGPVNILLKSAPAVYIGKISYSLYLWHWPLIVAAKFMYPASEAALVVAVVLSFALSSASYHFIEQPFRNGAPLRTPLRAFSFLAITSAISLSAAAYGRVTDGLPNRFPSVMAEIDTYLDKRYSQAFWKFDECDQRVPGLEKARDVCVAIDPNKKTILLIGDSHAQHIKPGIERTYPDANVIGIISGGCKFIRGWDHDRAPCGELRNYLFDTFDKWDEVDHVVVSMRQSKETIEGTAELADWLTTKHDNVTVIGPVVEYNPGLDELISANLTSPRVKIEEIAQSMIKTNKLAFGPQLQALLPEGVSYIDSKALLCELGSCSLFLDSGVPVIFDYGHFTPEGAEWFVGKWGAL